MARSWLKALGLLALGASGCQVKQDILSTSATLAFASTPRLGCSENAAALEAPIGVVADAQLHNQYGAGLFLDSRLAYQTARVGMRPPSLNLWNDLGLYKFVRGLVDGIRQSGGSPSPSS